MKKNFGYILFERLSFPKSNKKRRACEQKMIQDIHMLGNKFPNETSTVFVKENLPKYENLQDKTPGVILASVLVKVEEGFRVFDVLLIF